MKWNKVIIDKEGVELEAIAPEIVSASRATDVPAFHIGKLINDLGVGYTTWKNPFNNKESYVSFSNTRLIVFWTKDPRPLMDELAEIDKKIKNYYFHFTLNDYEEIGLEPMVPPLGERIDTFKELSQMVGKEKVIWRYDPLISREGKGLDKVLSRVKKIGDMIHGYTEKLVFSFADIERYKRVKGRLGSQYREYSKDEKEYIAQELMLMNGDWGLEIASCSEDIDLDKYGIKHNKCIDDILIRRLFGNDEKLMDFLDRAGKKDEGQRKDCRCIPSKDIGKYGTCKHGCKYCYAS
jgi:DNA repair photolyase